ncbi:MAG TPA: hypothetical protein VKE96_24255 [Vicinamibacterales bacterium]|nr:hypothetical protein [Vicinamibacterales bacterium]
MNTIRSQSRREAGTLPTPSRQKTARAAGKRFIRIPSLTRMQAIIGTLAGIASIVGAAFPLLQFARPPSTGELVAVVEAAGSRRSLTDATIEVLTPDNAIVATLTPDATGRAAQELKEGVYVVRISHPRYAADVRRVQLLPRQTLEIKASLRGGSSPSSPSRFERAVNDGVSAVRKALRF